MIIPTFLDHYKDEMSHTCEIFGIMLYKFAKWEYIQLFLKFTLRN